MMQGKTHPSATTEVMLRARAAGLDLAASRFPEDIAAAAEEAARARDDMPAIEDVAAEPWPPMCVRGAP